MIIPRFMTAVLAIFLALPATIAHALEVSEGTVSGLNMADGSVIYYGLPYAASPEGERRWQPPAAHEGWDGVRDATRQAQKNCPYLSIFMAA